MLESRQCLSVIIPAYNEEATIAHVVRQVLKLETLFEVIVVDDCSSDRTAEIIRGLAAEDSRIRLLQHDVNRGKTAGLRTGFAQVRGEIVIVQDADLGTTPPDPEVIQPILDGKADVVYGSRFWCERLPASSISIISVANKLLTFASNLFANLNLTNAEPGYKAFLSEICGTVIPAERGGVVGGIRKATRSIGQARFNAGRCADAHSAMLANSWRR